MYNTKKKEKEKNKIAAPAPIALLLIIIMSFTSIFNYFGTSYAQFAGSPEAPNSSNNNTSTTQGAAAAAAPPTSNNVNGTAAAVRPGEFDAAQIYRTNNITVIDPNIRNLAIIIPDNIGSNNNNRSTTTITSAPASLWPTFLPASATIAEGMRVIWFNADVNATHSIVVRNSTGAIINSTGIIPYQNASVYRFGHAGQYTFSDPSLPDSGGTINVVKPTSFNASSFTDASGTVGLFVIPAAGKTSFDVDINKLGFRALSTFNFTTFPSTANNTDTTMQNTDNGLDSTPGINGTSSSDAKILYAWSQETSGVHTTVTRIASKVHILEDILYPHESVKPSG